jgi:hypothetical protein
MAPPLLHQSIADMPEGALIRTLLADSHWRSRFLQIYGVPECAEAYPEVQLHGLGARGDIDILAVDPATPESATAIQVKRVKVSANAFKNGSPNKLAAIRELNRQSTLVADLGFHQVYSYVVVVIDSRENNSGEYTFKGLTNELRWIIEPAMTFHDLHPHAGFVQFELCQPVDDTPLNTGTFTCQVRRLSTARMQAQRVTSFVRAIIGSRDA